MAKSFKDMNDPAASVAERLVQDKPAKTGRPRMSKETRSHRTNILMTPSVYADLKDMATIEGTSVNQILNVLAQDYLRKNSSRLSDYRKAMQTLKAKY